MQSLIESLQVKSIRLDEAGKETRALTVIAPKDWCCIFNGIIQDILGHKIMAAQMFVCFADRTWHLKEVERQERQSLAKSFFKWHLALIPPLRIRSQNNTGLEQ